MNILERFGKWLARVQEPEVTVDELLALDTPKHLIEEWRENASLLTDYATIISGSRKYGDFEIQSCGLSEAEAIGMLVLGILNIWSKGIKKR